LFQLVALLALGSGVAGGCDPNVEYLRSGAHSGNGNNTAGARTSSGGTDGEGGSDTHPDGGQANGGESGAANTEGGNPAEGGSTPLGGSESGGAGTGGTASGSCVKSKAVRDTFDFDDGNVLIVNDSHAIKAVWAKGAYDSTDLKTGLTDAGSVASPPLPPDNPLNLANVSVLSAGTDGLPGASMKLALAFTGRQRQESEHMHILYTYATYGDIASVADLTNRTMTADVKLVSTPHSNCTISARTWSTATDSTATMYHRADGSELELRVGDWVTLAMDLDASKPANLVNQIGLTFDAQCDAEGAGGEGGLGPEDTNTIILIDNVSVPCK